jgi:protein-L-isoaspartate(D-aspartate) O-methyltransferase
MENFEMQRKNMVDNQVRPSDVTDRRILRAMLDVPREPFVAEDARSLAYSDRDLPMVSAGEPGRSRTLLRPTVLARMIQALDVSEDTSVVLDVGCGTGYGSALLARLAARVFALDDQSELIAHAVRNLALFATTNVTTVTGNLAAGWEAEAPFDAILVEGAVEEIPRALLDQLKDGGRLVAVRNEAGVGRALRWLRDGTSYGQQTLFDAAAPILPGFARQPQFVF